VRWTGFTRLTGLVAFLVPLATFFVLGPEDLSAQAAVRFRIKARISALLELAGDSVEALLRERAHFAPD
jgi:hypothetical protein